MLGRRRSQLVCGAACVDQGDAARPGFPGCYSEPLLEGAIEVRQVTET